MRMGTKVAWKIRSLVCRDKVLFETSLSFLYPASAKAFLWKKAASNVCCHHPDPNGLPITVDKDGCVRTPWWLLHHICPPHCSGQRRHIDPCCQHICFEYVGAQCGKKPRWYWERCFEIVGVEGQWCSATEKVGADCRPSFHKSRWP